MRPVTALSDLAQVGSASACGPTKTIGGPHPLHGIAQWASTQYQSNDSQAPQPDSLRDFRGFRDSGRLGTLSGTTKSAQNTQDEEIVRHRTLQGRVWSYYS